MAKPNFSTKDLRRMPIDLLYKLDIMEEALDSDLQRLLDKSNPFFTKYNLLEGSITYLELRGNSNVKVLINGGGSSKCSSRL